MHRHSISRLRAGLAAGLALTASACATPSAEKSAADGTGPGSTSGASAGTAAGTSGEQAGGEELTWWQRLRRYHREPEEKPWVYGDVRPGKGLLGGDEDGFVLYRQGEGGSSGDPNKPAKVRR